MKKLKRLKVKIALTAIAILATVFILTGFANVQYAYGNTMHIGTDAEQAYAVEIDPTQQRLDNVELSKSLFDVAMYRHRRELPSIRGRTNGASAATTEWVYDNQFAGVWYCPLGYLNIGVTCAQEVRDVHPNIVYQVLDFSYNFLLDVHAAIKNLMPRYNVFGVSITPQYNQVRVSVSSYEYINNINTYLKRLSLYRAGAVNFVMQEKPMPSSAPTPIHAGEHITHRNLPNGGGTISAKAICNSTGRRGIVTNAHNVKQHIGGGVWRWRDNVRHLTNNGNIIGNYSGNFSNSRYLLGGLADAAFVPFTHQQEWQFTSSAGYFILDNPYTPNPTFEWQPVTNVVSRTYQVQSSDDIRVGLPVAKFGRRTGRTEGYIAYTNWAGYVPPIGFLTNQVGLSIRAASGDSGSPVFIMSGGRYILAATIFAAGHANSRFAYASKITHIREGLNITILGDKTSEVGNPIGGRGFAGGTGTAADPFQIATASQLNRLSVYVNLGKKRYANAHYVLNNDITLNNMSTWNNVATRRMWTPIGHIMHNNYGFRGTFDGRGFVIRGMYANISNSSYQGLFGIVDGGTIINLGVAQSYIRGRYSGGIAGRVINGGRILNSFVDSSVTISGWRAGGIAGYLSGASVIANNFSAALIIAFAGGGIVGFVQDTNNRVEFNYFLRITSNANLNLNLLGNDVVVVGQANNRTFNHAGILRNLAGTANQDIVVGNVSHQQLSNALNSAVGGNTLPVIAHITYFSWTQDAIPVHMQPPPPPLLTTPPYELPVHLWGTEGQRLFNVWLPNGWSWIDGDAYVGNTGIRYHSARFTHYNPRYYSVVRLLAVHVSPCPSWLLVAETDVAQAHDIWVPFADVFRIDIRVYHWCDFLSEERFYIVYSTWVTIYTGAPCCCSKIVIRIQTYGLPYINMSIEWRSGTNFDASFSVRVYVQW